MEKEEQFNTCVVFMTRVYLQSGTWRQYFANSYHTGNAAVDLQHTLGIDVAVAGLSVGAKPRAMAASRLVTREARFTLSTAERALERTVHRLKQWKGFLLFYCGEKETQHGGLTMVLWHSELGVQPPLSGGPKHSSISSHTWQEQKNVRQ